MKKLILDYGQYSKLGRMFTNRDLRQLRMLLPMPWIVYGNVDGIGVVGLKIQFTFWRYLKGLFQFKWR